MADGYYYPGSRIDPFWAKNCLLFFDRLTLLTPPGHADPEELLSREVQNAPMGRRELQYLLDYEILQPLSANDVIDKGVAEELIEILVNCIVEHPSVYLSTEKSPETYLIHRAKLGSDAEPELFSMLMSDLQAYGAAVPLGDQGYWMVGPRLRALINVAQAVVVPKALEHRTLRKSWPITNFADVHLGVKGILRPESSSSIRQVFDFDSRVLNLDLSQIPVDEIISFRVKHLPSVRRYLLDIHDFLDELQRTPEALQEERWRERRQGIVEYLEELNRDLEGTGWRNSAPQAGIRISLVAALVALSIDGFQPEDVLQGIGALASAAGLLTNQQNRHSNLNLSSYSIFQLARSELGFVG